MADLNEITAEDRFLLRHLDNVGILIILAVPVGRPLKRKFTWRQIFLGQVPDWIFHGPPWWLDEPQIDFHDPLGWFEYRGNIPEHNIEVARNWLFGDWK